MFELEKAIAEWRQQIIAAGLKKGEALDELEDHLRKDVQQQIQAGLTTQGAFEIAVERIGGTQALKAEFAKVSHRTGFLAMLKGFLTGTRAPLIAFTPDAQQSLELARAEAPRLNHDFIGTEHVLLGLLNSQSGIVSNVMRRLGVECAVVRAEIEKVIGPGLPAKRVA